MPERSEFLLTLQKSGLFVISNNSGALFFGSFFLACKRNERPRGSEIKSTFNPTKKPNKPLSKTNPKAQT
jgi:hypothetical protein